MTTNPEEAAVAVVHACLRHDDIDVARYVVDHLLACPDLLIDLAAEANRRPPHR